MFETAKCHPQSCPSHRPPSDDDERFEKSINIRIYNLNGTTTVIIKKERQHTQSSGDGDVHIFIDLNKRQRKVSCCGGEKGIKSRTAASCLNVSFEASKYFTAFLVDCMIEDF